MTDLRDIRAIRKRLGFTQMQLAGELHVRQATISRMETGVTPVDRRTELALERLLLHAEAAGDVDTDTHRPSHDGADTVSAPVQSWGKEPSFSRNRTTPAEIPGGLA